MAGHSKFKNIQYRKGAQDKKRAKIFTKILREITVAAKMGSTDPNSNPRLRSAIIEAKNQNMPKDNIERAINKASNAAENSNFEEIRYEGYAQAGVSVIVEALTDNRNRTASEVRSTFTKSGGNLGEKGSVNFMFDRLGIITYSQTDGLDYDTLLEKAIEAEAEDVKEEDGEFLIITQPENLHLVSSTLSEKLGIDASSAKIQWSPKVNVEVTTIEEAAKVLKLIDALEDLDDVQNVFANFDIPDEIIAKL